MERGHNFFLSLLVLGILSTCIAKANRIWNSPGYGNNQLRANEQQAKPQHYILSQLLMPKPSVRQVYYQVPSADLPYTSAMYPRPPHNLQVGQEPQLKASGQELQLQQLPYIPVPQNQLNTIGGQHQLYYLQRQSVQAGQATSRREKGQYESQNNFNGHHLEDHSPEHIFYTPQEMEWLDPFPKPTPPTHPHGHHHHHPHHHHGHHHHHSHHSHGPGGHYHYHHYHHHGAGGAAAAAARPANTTSPFWSGI